MGGFILSPEEQKIVSDARLSFHKHAGFLGFVHYASEGIPFGMHRDQLPASQDELSDLELLYILKRPLKAAGLVYPVFFSGVVGFTLLFALTMNFLLLLLGPLLLFFPALWYSQRYEKRFVEKFLKEHCYEGQA